ncbi:NAD-dependent epimerase/dehydratase family protein [Rothia kristinae]|uniref:NAD-dependent epimerase/dehydratase family protein n=1 Tax=Rothia kristinae TaxID=37923 RepID=UPI001643C308|nr:NAD-dependent epimerase/dehydratase family protein [Rothia kristinae]MED6046119.1 NAD-dependent epimerase/dehydratase family protein [Rothia kristinae]
MERILILGAGPVGAWSARALVEDGFRVTLVSRSGVPRIPLDPRAAIIAADVTDRRRVVELTARSDVVINAMNPPTYRRWRSQWPLMADSVLTAVQRHRLRYIIVGNLYAYGPVTAPMTEETPLHPVGVHGTIRRVIWERALAAHAEDRARICEIRSSDYLGPGAGPGSLAHLMVLSRARAGRRPLLVVGDPHAPHTFTDVRTVGALVSRLAREPWDSDVWGRPWHTPSDHPISLAEMAAHAAGADAASSTATPLRIPRWMLRAGALVHPDLRALRDIRYQFDEPFIMDSDAAQKRFALSPPPVLRSIHQTT